MIILRPGPGDEISERNIPESSGIQTGPDWPSIITVDQQACEWEVSVVLSQKPWGCLLHSTITVIAEKDRGSALLGYYNSSSRSHSLSFVINLSIWAGFSEYSLHQNQLKWKQDEIVFLPYKVY